MHRGEPEPRQPVEEGLRLRVDGRPGVVGRELGVGIGENGEGLELAMPLPPHDPPGDGGDMVARAGLGLGGAMGAAEGGEGLPVGLGPAFLGEQHDMADRRRRHDAQMRACVQLVVQDGAERMVLHARRLPRRPRATEARLTNHPQPAFHRGRKRSDAAT